jgi:hypothetical protein
MRLKMEQIFGGKHRGLKRGLPRALRGQFLNKRKSGKVRESRSKDLELLALLKKLLLLHKERTWKVNT